MVRETNACLPALCRLYSRGFLIPLWNRECLYFAAMRLQYGKYWLLDLWEQGGGGKSYCPWQQKKPLPNCKPSPVRRKSAEKIAACAAGVAIISNNHNASRAGQTRRAAAFMQVDEHEAGNVRAHSGTASRRLFALFALCCSPLVTAINTSRPCISLLS